MDPFASSHVRSEARPAPSLPSPPVPASSPAPSLPGRDGRGLLSFLDGLQSDDYILLGIIAVLFFEGCDDYILLAALGYLFVMGIL